MSDVIKGAKNLLFSFLFLTSAYFATLHFQTSWQTHVTNLSAVLYSLFVISFLFSWYFKQSRISFLTLLLLAVYLFQLNGISSSNEQLYVGVLFALLLLSFIKERGIATIPGLIQLTLFSLSQVASFGYVYAGEHYVSQLSVELALVVTLVLVIYQSIRKPSVAQSAIFMSLIAWALMHFKLIAMPLNILLIILLAFYLVLVIIESYFLAYRDELTSLPSRRALNQYSTTLSGKYTVAMLDIDHFKKFNDTYGHDVGDQVLKLVASKIGQVRKSGKAFRYGGEEFTLVFNRKNSEQVMSELERIRKLIANYKIVIRQAKRQSKNARAKQKVVSKKVSVTVSIGAAEKQAKQDFEQTIKCADQALYKAKKAGRNRVHS
ncbi:GGDEF domain-containing protein [Thalassotalea crassostreae]|uniref:GGDEF domain-containing protein n=1 Tax=Thalassotalea crassostreae TaxID=1763536 RepID=UPI0009ECDF43|nr:GGDEF domain-containing protein [Thalassotalea crassostreae]